MVNLFKYLFGSKQPPTDTTDSSVNPETETDTPTTQREQRLISPYLDERYDIVDPRQETDIPTLKSVGLVSRQCQYHVVFHNKRMFDLVLFNQSRKEHVQLIDKLTLLHNEHKNGVHHSPPLPELYHVSTVIDSAVLSLPGALVEINHLGDKVYVDQKKLTQWYQHCDSGVFSLEVRDHQVTEGTDQDDVYINRSIQDVTKRRIKKRLADTINIPPLSPTASMLIDLRSNLYPDVSRLVTIIEHDPIVTANVMRLASSSAYFQAKGVKSITDAVIRVLGYDTVMNMALGLVLSSGLNPATIPRKDLTRYWQRTMVVANLTAKLASHYNDVNNPETGVAYMGGLLYDFGYLVLAHTFPPHFKVLSDMWKINDHLDHNLIEKHLLGITREMISAELFRNWGIPDVVVEAVRYVKTPSQARGVAKELAKLIHYSIQLVQGRYPDFDTQFYPPETIDMTRILGQDTVNKELEKAYLAMEGIYSIAKELVMVQTAKG